MRIGFYGGFTTDDYCEGPAELKPPNKPLLQAQRTFSCFSLQRVPHRRTPQSALSKLGVHASLRMRRALACAYMRPCACFAPPPHSGDTSEACLIKSGGLKMLIGSNKKRFVFAKAWREEKTFHRPAKSSGGRFVKRTLHKFH